MKISEKWLRQWVNPEIPREELVQQLTMLGLEVEGCSPVASVFSDVVVGEILQTVPHPDAERLQVCQVSIAANTTLTIVSAAENVRAGLKVAVAKPGASLSNGKKITETDLRGIRSQGMLCSQADLGLAETSTGIWELPPDTPSGKDLWFWLDMDDYSLDINLTPNRGDCLSIAGIARELAVANRTALTPPTINAIPSQIAASLPVVIDAPADCPRYIGRIIRGVNPAAITPLWMQEALRRSGLRCINPIVDIVNYVMLELGQPLHTFDLKKLSEALHVRRAVTDEKITLLDGQTVTLDPDTLVIADKQQAHAIAGVMGSIDSAVSATTTEIFLESAFFNPLTIAGKARHYGLTTDASQRFERGVDPSLQRKASDRAVSLLIEIAGGQAGPLLEISSESHLPPAITILLRRQRISRILGLTIPDADIEDILTRLGMNIVSHSEGWEAAIPHYRFDLKQEIDLIEELARVYGYHKVPEQKLNGSLSLIPQSETKTTVAALRKTLIDRGYQEAITYSFINPELQKLLDPDNSPLRLINPISHELSAMRTNLWAGLLTAVQYNLNRQQSRIRLFETGLRYLPQGDSLLQQPVISGITIGNAYPEQWGVPSRPVDFFDVKADLEALLLLGNRSNDHAFNKGKHPALHPGQCSHIERDGKIIGYLGALHPAIEQHLELSNHCYLFEIALEPLLNCPAPHFMAISRFPSIRRDIAIVIDETIAIEEIFASIRQNAGDLLKNLQLFDIYQGKNIEAGQKSVALGLTLQHASRTLVEDEIQELMERVISALQQQFAVILRI